MKAIGTGYPHSFIIEFLEREARAGYGPTSSAISLRVAKGSCSSPSKHRNRGTECYLSFPYIQDFTTGFFLVLVFGQKKKKVCEAKTKLKQGQDHPRDLVQSCFHPPPFCKNLHSYQRIGMSYPLSNQCHIQCPINVIPCASQPHSPLLLQNRASFSPSSPLLNPVSLPIFDDPMASLFISQFHSSLTSSTPIHPPTEPSHHSELLFLWNLKLQYPTLTIISYSQFHLLNIHSLSSEVAIQLHIFPASLQNPTENTLFPDKTRSHGLQPEQTSSVTSTTHLALQTSHHSKSSSHIHKSKIKFNVCLPCSHFLAAEYTWKKGQD